MNHVLSWITFFPIIGMVVVLFLPRERLNLVRWTAAVTSAVPLVLSIWLFANFDRSTAAMQFVERVGWIPRFNISYFMGIDGISIPMVLLTALLSFICMFASWGITRMVKGYFALFLLLETGMIGVFCALDFFLFYVFWEVMLLPMYFLIGIWGGPRREYAAIKFFLYTLARQRADAPVHAGALLPSRAAHVRHDPALDGHVGLRPDLPDGRLRRSVHRLRDQGAGLPVPHLVARRPRRGAHRDLGHPRRRAPEDGHLRHLADQLPDPARSATQWFSGALALLGVVNIVYGALCAMAQTDLKKLVAYSSVSHMGYCLLGMAALTPAGMNGALFQMFNHGTTTAMLFLLVGVIYDRAHHREIAGFGGLALQMPVYTGIVMIAFFASLGLPGLSGFISEALVFLGAYPVFKTLTIFAVAGIVITAGYWLWTLQRMFLGTLPEKYKTLPDINGRELFTLIPLGLIVLFLGIFPMPVLNLMTRSLDWVIEMAKRS